MCAAVVSLVNALRTPLANLLYNSCCYGFTAKVWSYIWKQATKDNVSERICAFLVKLGKEVSNGTKSWTILIRIGLVCERGFAKPLLSKVQLYSLIICTVPHVTYLVSKLYNPWNKCILW